MSGQFQGEQLRGTLQNSFPVCPKWLLKGLDHEIFLWKLMKIRTWFFELLEWLCDKPLQVPFAKRLRWKHIGEVQKYDI